MVGGPAEGDRAPEESPAPRSGARLPPWAVALTVAISLAGTADMIFRDDVRDLYRENPDIRAILHHAGQVTPADVVGWWTGNWLEKDSFYYRPVASTLIYAEYLLFRERWRPYCVVTWLMHAGVCVTVFFLLRRLVPGPPSRQIWVGVLAVALFSIPCEIRATGDHWGNRGIARGVMPYWPAQTDVGSLLFSLLALLYLDRWLDSRSRTRRTGVSPPSRRTGVSPVQHDFTGPESFAGTGETPVLREGGALVASIVCFLVALGFKEHAVIVPLLALALAAYRWAGRARLIGITAVGLGISGLFLLVRLLAVPGAWGPQYKGEGHLARKALLYLAEPARAALHYNQEWIIASALIVTACFAVSLYRPRLWKLGLIGALVGVFLPPTIQKSAPMLPTLPPEGVWLLRLCLILGAFVLAWEARKRSPAFLLLVCLPVVHAPIMYVLGPHYYYWPVCWWAMLNACVLFAAGDLFSRSRTRGTAPSSTGTGT